MALTNPNEVTQLLAQVQEGRPEAAERLLALVYDDLRAIARRQLNGQAPGHTLQPTALVNEAYMRLAPQAAKGLNDRSTSWLWRPRPCGAS